MSKTLTLFISIVLLLHGIIHLMGTAVYLKWMEIEGFPFKTTVFGGHWDLGEVGIKIYGMLWALAFLGFIASVVTLLNGWQIWTNLLWIVTLFSLLLTIMDWHVAYAGVIINLIILFGLTVGPSLGRWMSNI